MADRKLKQTDRIYQYMKDFGSITSAEAMTDLGVYRLASRIHDMRMMGIGIVKETVSGKNIYGEKISYAKYKLED